MSGKECPKCNTFKAAQLFHKAPKKADGLATNCKACNLLRQKELRATHSNKNTKRYEKTKKGFLVRLYRNMESRVSGIQKQKAYLYRGLDLLPREQFYAWAEGSDKFHRLFSRWEESGYDRTLTPSVDRIDSEKGYLLSNMQWLTHSENSTKACIERWAA